MELTIISAKDFKIKLKGSIHASGRLGFTEATADRLNFEENKAVKFAKDSEDTLYLIPVEDEDDDSFKVMKAGRYYSINTKALFDNLGLDYKKNTIWFDMVEQYDANLNKNIYKLLKTEKLRKKEKE